MKAKAKWYEEERESTLLVAGGTDVRDTDNIGADAFERVELQKQIKEAMRDYY